MSPAERFGLESPLSDFQTEGRVPDTVNAAAKWSGKSCSQRKENFLSKMTAKLIYNLGLGCSTICSNWTDSLLI